MLTALKISDVYSNNKKSIQQRSEGALFRLDRMAFDHLPSPQSSVITPLVCPWRISSKVSIPYAHPLPSNDSDVSVFRATSEKFPRPHSPLMDGIWRKLNRLEIRLKRELPSIDGDKRGNEKVRKQTCVLSSKSM